MTETVEIRNNEENISANINMAEVVPKFEYLNIALLTKVCKNNGADFDLEASIFKKLTALRRMSNRVSGKYEPEYKRSGATLDGRLFSVKGITAQGIPKVWRNALAYTNYWDCDMINASWQIALDLAKELGTPHAKIESRCQHREFYLTEHIKKNGGSREDAKKHYLEKLFTHKTNFKPNTLPAEISLLHTALLATDDGNKTKTAIEQKLTKDKKPKTNIEGKVFANIVFNREAKLLEIAIKKLKQDKIETGGLMCDGVFIRKSKASPEIKPDLTSLNNYLKEVENTSVQFKIKDMTEFPEGITEELYTLTRADVMNEERAQYEELRRQFEEEWCVCKVRNGGRLFRRSLETPDGIRVETYSQTSLVDVYRDWEPAGSFRTSIITGGDKGTFFIKNWIDDHEKKVYDMAAFMPCLKYAEGHPTIYNDFKGFQVQRTLEKMIEPSEEDLKDYDLIGKYIYNLFKDKDDEQSNINFEYIMRWLAQMFQKPMERSEIMIVLKGRKGIGKSDFSEMLKAMMGTAYWAKTADPVRDLWGSFNDLMECKTFVHIDEPEGIDNEQAIEKLKDAITAKHFNVKRKFCDTSVQRAFFNCFMTLNHEGTGIPITADNRRFAMFESATLSYKGNEYDKFYHAIRNPNALALFYKDLMEYNMAGWSWGRETIPKTDFLERSMKNSIKNNHQFLEQLLLAKHTRISSQVYQQINGDYIGLCGSIYKGYCKYCDEIGDNGRSRLNGKDFKTELRCLDGINIKRTSVKAHNINGDCYIIDVPVLTETLRGLGLDMPDSLDEAEFLESDDETNNDDLDVGVKTYQSKVHSLNDL
jgi:hypothetical protein